MDIILYYGDLKIEGQYSYSNTVHCTSSASRVTPPVLVLPGRWGDA